jgi:thiol-disulfide isomerase/thioredoxin
VGEFQVGKRGDTSGTFLTTTGDYRFLAGSVDRLYAADGPPGTQAIGYRLRLSCFDGAHAFLFEAVSQPDGSLSGDFWSGNRSHDTWTAVRNPEAALPDGFTLTHASNAVALSDLVFPDLDGVPHRLSDPQFAGKARILEIFGSWCPNCADEADELVTLQAEYGPMGLSITGLAFELTGDRARDAEQVRRYAKRHGVTWPLLVCGVSDRDKATAALGLLDHLNAYPTTLFLDAAGNVRAVYTGYCGPATGEAYVQQHAAFVKQIETLLGL